MSPPNDWDDLVRPTYILAKIIANHGVEITVPMTDGGGQDIHIANFGDRLTIQVSKEEAAHLIKMDREIN